MKNNDENTSTAFGSANGNGDKNSQKTEHYFVKVADVTERTFNQIPSTERTSYPLGAIDYENLRISPKGGAPIKVDKGDVYEIYNTTTKTSLAFLLGTKRKIKSFANSNPGVFIDTLKNSEQPQSAPAEPDVK